MTDSQETKAALQRPILPKWPFWIADFFLVSIALLIAFKTGGPVSFAQVAWCVFSISLGAFIFITPYLIEFGLRYRANESSQLNCIETLSKEIDQIKSNESTRFMDIFRSLNHIEERLHSINGEDPPKTHSPQTASCTAQKEAEVACSIGAAKETASSFASKKKQPMLSKALSLAEAENTANVVSRFIKGASPEKQNG